jgi:hypothetical protein
MRLRSWRVLVHIEPGSNALVNPYRVSISSSCRATSDAGREATSVHFLSKKCTWLFQNPAVIVSPEQSITWLPCGIGVERLFPTPTIFPPSIRTTPSRTGSSAGLT